MVCSRCRRAAELDVQREQRRLATDQYARHRREAWAAGPGQVLDDQGLGGERPARGMSESLSRWLVMRSTIVLWKTTRPEPAFERLRVGASLRVVPEDVILDASPLKGTLSVFRTEKTAGACCLCVLAAAAAARK